MDHDELNRVCADVRAFLAQNPSAMRSVMDAVIFGAQDALHLANERAGKLDLAFRSALSLAEPARLSPEVRDMLGRAIAAAIPEEGRSPVEERAFKRFG